MKALGLKLVAFLAAVIAVLLAVIGYKNKTIEEQDDELDAYDKKDEIRENMKQHVKQNTKDEAKQIEEENKKSGDMSKRDKFDSL